MPSIHALFATSLAMSTAMLVSAALIPFLDRLAVRFGIVAKPGPDRPHAMATPLLGGVAIMAGFALANCLFGGSIAVPNLRLAVVIFSAIRGTSENI